MLWRTGLLLLAILTASCTDARASEYYQVSQNEAVYIAWTQDSVGRLQGQVEVVAISSNTSVQLKTTNAAFNGTRSGPDVSLAFGMFSTYGGATWTGHVSGSTLTLIIPTNGVPQQLVLKAGSFNKFSAAISRMQDRVEVNQARLTLYKSMQDAFNHLKDGNGLITSGLASLNAMFPIAPPRTSLRTAYQQAWRRMQADWAEEQSEAQTVPLTCGQRGRIEYQSGKVNYVLGQFNYIDGQVRYLNSQYVGAVHKVTSGISELKDWAPVLDVRARAFFSSVGKQYNGNATALVGSTVKKASDSLRAFNARWLAFESDVRRYDRAAKQLDNKASAFATSLKCSD